MDNMCLKNITSEVSMAKYFAIMIDEFKDRPINENEVLAEAVIVIK